jgi:hypothetical protein
MIGRIVFALISLLAFNAANASLIGSTVTYTNQAAPELNGTFLIGNGIEDSHCYIPGAGGVCLLGIEVDWGADTVTDHLFNRTSVSLQSAASNVTTSVFSGVYIAGFTPVSSNFPVPIDVSFTSNSITTVNNHTWIWAANSDYTLVGRITTVPEPATLTLFVGGLIGLIALRRRRGRSLDRIDAPVPAPARVIG